MLSLLVKYARDQSLVAEPGFAPKSARWTIACDAEGRFLDVLPLGGRSGEGNEGRRFPRSPELSQPELKRGGQSEPRAHFLIETAQVVALYFREAEELIEVDKAKGKHAYFVYLLGCASEVIPELGRVARLLADEASLQQIRDRLRALRAKPIDKVTVSLGTHCWVEADAWHDWWRSFRRELNSARQARQRGESDRARMICLATGELVSPAATHPKIVGLADVGGIGMGSPLVGYDKEAFLSLGLQQSANGAVSEEAAAAYRAALNHLLKNHSHRVAGARVAHWFTHNVPPADDPIPWLEEPDDRQELTAQRRATDLLHAIRTGEREDLAGNHFYAVTLSGATGRVMVRDWMEGQFEQLVENIGAWFSDLSIVSYLGFRLAKNPGIERVVTCLLPPMATGQKYLDWVKPIGSARAHLWHAALCKAMPIPFEVLARVVALNRRFVQTGQLEDAVKNPRDLGLVVSVLQARMGLMKAYHIRKMRGGSPLKPFLNEDHPDPSYHCGRLMAVLAELQRAALGDVGAGVVQRFYASASTTPALVLGRLTRLSEFHLNKLDGGLAYWYRCRIAGIWARIEDYVPAVLRLEQQSLFALGYYQQMAADGCKKSKDNGKGDVEEPNA